MIRILMIAGSLRKGSFNRQLAEKAREMIGDRAEVSILDYHAIPYMNQDIEFPAPEEIERVREEVQNSDGVWIFSPEYNYNIPGVLKNLLDWLSRPLVKGDPERITVMTGKPVTLSGAGGQSGASNARKRLSELMIFMKAKHMEGEETSVALTSDEFASSSLTFTPERIEMLQDQAERFIEFISKNG